MSDLWRNRPWFKRGVFYYLYLVVLKDNYYRTRRAGRWARVNARLAFRFVVRYFSGRRWTVPMPDKRAVMRARIDEFIRAMRPQHYAYRRENNRDLLTGMLVALTAGHSLYMTGWQRYKYAAARRSNSRNVPVTLVGRPVVYQDQLKNKLGVTEFHQDYVSRAEQLAPRRARAALRGKA